MIIPGNPDCHKGLRIISLFDFSGNWARFFAEDGYDVELVDIKHGKDIFTWELPPGPPVWGILAAPECTDFSVSGAQWWPAKDADGRTEYSLAMVDRTLELITEIKPHFWILENPIGRLPRLRPDFPGSVKMIVHPWQFAGYAPESETDRYTKATVLRGDFTLPPQWPLSPIMHTTADGKKGSWMWAKLGGKSERTKTLRSTTPLGLARATWLANRKQ